MAFGTLVLWPFEDWSISNKVALFQALVVITGFGAALAVVTSVVWQSSAGHSTIRGSDTD
jgi:hypothetical protein